MLKKLRLFILAFSSTLLFMAPLAGTATVSAIVDQTTINGNLCSGSNGDLSGGTNTNCNGQATTTANSLITEVINILSVIVGIVAVIMIIFGGFRYVTSGGKQESVQSAKNTILYAIIGLVIVALAQIIVHFVLNKTTTATG